MSTNDADQSLPIPTAAVRLSTLTVFSNVACISGTHKPRSTCTSPRLGIHRDGQLILLLVDQHSCNARLRSAALPNSIRGFLRLAEDGATVMILPIAETAVVLTRSVCQWKPDLKAGVTWFGSNLNVPPMLLYDSLHCIQA